MECHINLRVGLTNVEKTEIIERTKKIVHSQKIEEIKGQLID